MSKLYKHRNLIIRHKPDTTYLQHRSVISRFLVLPLLTFLEEKCTWCKPYGRNKKIRNNHCGNSACWIWSCVALPIFLIKGRPFCSHISNVSWKAFKISNSYCKPTESKRSFISCPTSSLFTTQSPIITHKQAEILINRCLQPQPPSPYERWLVGLTSFPFRRTAFTAYWKWDCRTAKPGEAGFCWTHTEHKVCSIFPDITSFPQAVITDESHFVIISGSPKLASAVLCWKTTFQFLGKANQQRHKWQTPKFRQIHVFCFSLVRQAIEIFNFNYVQLPGNQHKLSIWETWQSCQ